MQQPRGPVIDLLEEGPSYRYDYRRWVPSVIKGWLFKTGYYKLKIFTTKRTA
jgi:hypothetical protein